MSGIKLKFMTHIEYLNAVLKTEASDASKIIPRLEQNWRLLHALIGINTENGELQDQFKKHIFYGKPLDSINLIEELGDLMWYVALACDELSVSFDQVFERNIAKLQVRYKDACKFTETQALNRDLEKERKILET